MTILISGLGDGDHPGGVLIGACLHRQVGMEGTQFGAFLGILRVAGRRVVAKHRQFHPL